MARRTLLAIATTGGPSVIRAFGFDDGARRSQIVRFEQAHMPVGVNTHFHSFDEVLRRRLRMMGFAVPEDPLILEVDAEIDTGSSWQLGLAAAHMLHARGRLATEPAQGGDARRVVVTGQVGTNRWDAKPVEGIAEKLQRAEAFLAAVPAGDRLFLLPADNAAEASGPPEGVAVHPIGDLEALAGVLLPAAATAEPAAAAAAPPPARRRPARLALALGLTAAVIGAAVVVGLDAPDGSTPPGAEEATANPAPDGDATPTLAAAAQTAGGEAEAPDAERTAPARTISPPPEQRQMAEASTTAVPGTDAPAEDPADAPDAGPSAPEGPGRSDAPNAAPSVEAPPGEDTVPAAAPATPTETPPVGATAETEAPAQDRPADAPPSDDPVTTVDTATPASPEDETPPIEQTQIEEPQTEEAQNRSAETEAGATATTDPETTVDEAAEAEPAGNTATAPTDGTAGEAETADGTIRLAPVALPEPEIYIKTYRGDGGCRAVALSREFGGRALPLELVPVPPGQTSIAGSFTTPVCGLQFRPGNAPPGSRIEVSVERAGTALAPRHDPATGAVDLDLTAGSAPGAIALTVTLSAPETETPGRTPRSVSLSVSP
ncbi:MAG: hypothetical protein AAFV49_14140 [Pseudomonadota bacterium]